MGQQRGERGKLMVDPRTQKADAQDHRSAQPLQAFLEIRAILLGDVMQARRRQCGTGGGTQAVEIADHRFGR